MKTRGITEGAIFCALTVVLALLTNFVPFLMLLTFFIPIPMVILGKRQGLKVSIISSVAAIIIIILFLGPISGFLYGCFLLIVGCSVGYTYFKDFSPGIKVGVGYFAFGITVVLIFSMTNLITGTDIVADSFRIIEMTSKEVFVMYEQMGIDPGKISEVQKLMDSQLIQMKLIFPSAMLLVPIIFSYINVLVADLLLKRLGYTVKRVQPITKWRMPESLKYVLFVFMIGNLIITFLGITAIPEIYTKNLMQIAYFCYSIMGLSLMFDFMESRRIKNIFWRILVVLMMMLLGLQFIIIFLGIADTYMDLRKIIPREEPKQ